MRSKDTISKESAVHPSLDSIVVWDPDTGKPCVLVDKKEELVLEALSNSTELESPFCIQSS